MQDILDNFEFRNQIPRLSKADALGTLIEKFTSPDIDLSPHGLDNHGMGTVFEELVRPEPQRYPDWLRCRPGNPGDVISAL